MTKKMSVIPSFASALVILFSYNETKANDFKLKVNKAQYNPVKMILVNKKKGRAEIVNLSTAKDEAKNLVENNPALETAVAQVQKETVNNNKFNESVQTLEKDLSAQNKTLKNPVVRFYVYDETDPQFKKLLPSNYQTLSEEEKVKVLKTVLTEFRADVKNSKNKMPSQIIVFADSNQPLTKLPDVARDQLVAHNFDHNDINKFDKLTENKLIVLASAAAGLTPAGRAINGLRIIGSTLILAACGDGSNDGSAAVVESLNCNCRAELAWQPQNDTHFFTAYKRRAGSNDQWDIAGVIHDPNATSMTTDPFLEGEWELAITASRWWDSDTRQVIESPEKSNVVIFTSPRPTASSR